MGAKCYVLIGLPGAGKSTYARQLVAREGARLYAFDQMCHNGLTTVTSQDELYLVFHRLAIPDLLSGRSVVLDHTNHEMKWRRYNNATLRGRALPISVTTIGIHIDVTLEVSFARIEQRKKESGHSVPAVAVDKIYRALSAEPPSVSEGFDVLRRLDKDHQLVNQR